MERPWKSIRRAVVKQTQMLLYMDCGHCKMRSISPIRGAHRAPDQTHAFCEECGKAAYFAERIRTLTERKQS